MEVTVPYILQSKETYKFVCQVLDPKMEKCGTTLSGKNSKTICFCSGYVERIFSVCEVLTAVKICVKMVKFTRNKVEFSVKTDKRAET